MTCIIVYMNDLFRLMSTRIDLCRHHFQATTVQQASTLEAECVCPPGAGGAECTTCVAGTYKVPKPPKRNTQPSGLSPSPPALGVGPNQAWNMCNFSAGREATSPLPARKAEIKDLWFGVPSLRARACAPPVRGCRVHNLRRWDVHGSYLPYTLYHPYRCTNSPLPFTSASQEIENQKWLIWSRLCV